MALKFLGDDPRCGFDSQAIEAIAYAKSFGVRIANASWGGVGGPTDAPELYDAIADSGMLFVAAAGNDGIDNDDGPVPALPASFDLPNIISVAAVDNTGGLAAFSNYGATTRRHRRARRRDPERAARPTTTYPTPGWGWLDGTSMAAPHVTGVAALVASMLPALADDPVALRARLLGSGKAMPRHGRADRHRPDRRCRTARSTSSRRWPRRRTRFGFVAGSTMSSTTTVPVRVGWPAATDDRPGVGAYGARASGPGPGRGRRRSPRRRARNATGRSPIGTA